MQDTIILKTIVRLLLPFIMLYALYIQFHGELSPGGGFQSGVIFAACLIVYSLVNDLASLQKLMPVTAVRIIAACGVLLYSGVGIIAMLQGGQFLAYNWLSQHLIFGQKMGIMLVEFGVGTTVFAVIMLIFYSFATRSNDAN